MRRSDRRGADPVRVAGDVVRAAFDAVGLHEDSAQLVPVRGSQPVEAPGSAAVELDEPVDEGGAVALAEAVATAESGRAKLSGCVEVVPSVRVSIGRRSLGSGSRRR